MLSERPERLYDDLHKPDNLVAELKEAGKNIERWYKLMLEPGYLASELKATLSWWHNVSLDGESLQGRRKQAKNDVLYWGRTRTDAS
jgi:hypothetical protein